MSKGLKWTLIIAGGLIAVFAISKIMGGGKKTEKVSTGKFILK
jgi:hypothetical protein